jgi:hypothetical protein
MVAFILTRLPEKRNLEVALLQGNRVNKCVTKG